jgi:hypothetical protein
VVGEATLGLLREDEPPVRDHVELALRALSGLRLVAPVLQLSRETRGSFVVAVSDRAVEDLDAHAAHPSHTNQGRRSRYQPSSAV